MATINQTNAQLNEVVDGIQQEVNDTTKELKRKKDYVLRLNDHWIDNWKDSKRPKRLSKKRKPPCRNWRSPAYKRPPQFRNLLSKISSLEEEVGEQVGQNDALTDSNAELECQLEKVKGKYKKSREAKKKMDKLRSQWAGIANTFGADIKQEADDGSDSSAADLKILRWATVRLRTEKLPTRSISTGFLTASH
jgi:hypothetical protein